MSYVVCYRDRANYNLCFGSSLSVLSSQYLNNRTVYDLVVISISYFTNCILSVSLFDQYTLVDNPSLAECSLSGSSYTHCLRWEPPIIVSTDAFISNLWWHCWFLESRLGRLSLRIIVIFWLSHQSSYKDNKGRVDRASVLWYLASFAIL